MRVPLSWLKEFVDISMSVEELAQRITLAGLEVDAIEYVGVAGAELPWDADKILVGNILEVRQHPNADRLVLAEVDYGAGASHTVVTGAPNLYPYKGQGRLTHALKSVFAKEGAELYDGHVEGKVKVKLKARPVRGVMSDAMLCSEKELGMSEEHEGILLLPDDAPTGAPLREYLGDAVLTIAITPNYARALSILGVAREVAALTGATLRLPEPRVEATGASIAGRAQVTVAEPELCPRFTATLIEGVQVGPSPYWMQRRLTLAGMRPIFNVVDISNYVMIELGMPSHMFDADNVQDQHLVVRRARPGERLTTLDGKERALSPERLMVCDPSGPLSIAGVMGGAHSEVSATTTRVLLEAAIWNPAQIRRSAQAFKLHSEASRRYERGVDYELPPLAQRRLLGLIQQVAGGVVAQGIIDDYQRPWQPVTLDLPPAEVRRIVGITLTAEAIAALLRPLGFGCAVVGSEAPFVRVSVPSARLDVTMLADLCEEVARMYGYERIPATLLADTLPAQQGDAQLDLEQKTRDVLARAGLDEAITYSLTSMESVARVEPAAADAARYLKLANPTTPERAYMRRSLLPTLLEALAANGKERDRTLLFEVGRVYLPQEDAVLPDEPRRVALALMGPRAPLAWHGAGEALNFFDLKGVVETLLTRLNIAERVQFVPVTDDARFHPGRAAALIRAQASGGRGQKADPQAPPPDLQPLGVLGELHPDVRERLGLSAARALAAELDLEALLALVQPVKYKPISRFPATSQDFALIVGLHVPAQRVAEAIRKYAGKELEALTLFDIYEGPQVGAGKRSLAYRLAFRTPDHTLSDEDVSKIRAKIMRGLEREVGATLRA